MTATTAKFHISKKGTVEPCNASVKACPLGGQHFDTEDDAQDYLAFEASVKAKADFEREYKALQLDTVREGEEVELKDRFGNKKQVRLGVEWVVRDSMGQVIGGLEYRMTAHEKRRRDNPRARRRWMAPGWIYYVGDPLGRRLTVGASTKKAALTSMLSKHQERAAEG